MAVELMSEHRIFELSSRVIHAIITHLFVAQIFTRSEISVMFNYVVHLHTEFTYFSTANFIQVGGT
jgi:hypothetical protein